MTNFSLTWSGPLQGAPHLPGDKSITHRAIILSALSSGTTRIINPAFNEDCLATIAAFRKLGVTFKIKPALILVNGKSLRGLKPAKKSIFTSNSGTTMRLLAGVLAGQDFNSVLTASTSLSERPMERIVKPLSLMGSIISGRRLANKQEQFPPLKIKGSILRGVTYRLPVASAQVKSALLLAGLYAKGKTTIIEPVKTRDHTERMLKLFKADIKVNGNSCVINKALTLVSPKVVNVASDISSASFFVVAALLCPGSLVHIKSVNLNPTRTGCLKVLKGMGASIKIINQKIISAEPVGDLMIKSSKLKGAVVNKQEIPS